MAVLARHLPLSFPSILNSQSSIRIMGILNVTPNSFSEVGRYQLLDDALIYAEKILTDGASIIDIGGEPTNPGVHPFVSLQEELDRVIPVIEAIKKNFAITVSVDTSKPEVMQEAINAGAELINDVRALCNPAALTIAAKADIPVCLMHMAFPEGKNNHSVYDYGDDLVQHIKNFLQERINICLAAGIKSENIIIDPGFGAGNFGKNMQQNLELLNRLDEFLELGYPILAGLSRKTFIGELLNLPVADRLNASLAAAVIAVIKGATIIRTHDVKATVEAIKVTQAVLNQSQLL